MSKIASVHVDPQINPQLEHNDRTDNRSKNIYKDKSHLNECDKSAKEVRQEIDKLYNEAMEKQKGKKGKKTPKENSFKEFIYEINEDTTMEQCKELTQKIAELTGFRPLQITIHRDEGHINKNGEFVTHYHAHAVFFTLDKDTGKQLARLQKSLNPKNLSIFQDLAAETFQMKRGEERFKKGEKKAYPKDYREIKRIREREREIIEKALELKENALELKNSNEVIQRELKRKESDLNAKESEIQKIEKGYPEAFNEINLKRNQEKKGFINFFKNVLTGGKHFKQIDQKYNIAKNAIIAQKKQNEEILRLEREKLEKEKKRHKEIENEHTETINKLSDAVIELERIKKYQIEKMENYKRAQKEADKEILKNIDYDKEMEYLRRTGDLDPKLSKAQQETLHREMDKRFKAEQQNTQQSKKIFSQSYS